MWRTLAAFAAALAVVASTPLRAADLSDAQVVALARKHCVPCHSSNPTHPAFDRPPRGLLLETLDELKKNAAKIYEEAVEVPNMPLGNETDMTDDERAALGRWIKALQ